jgi:Domain of unknown function (DUF1857)
MRFEHLLQVTDPGNPQIPPMSRDELWRGLLVRVHEPQRFPLGPDRCEARAGRHAEEHQRTVHFGALRFDDTVKLDPAQRITFTPQPHEGAAPVNLSIAIEEPAPGALYLRFVYEVVVPPEGASAEERSLQRYREQAWLELDRDMLATLREWQATGSL